MMKDCEPLSRSGQRKEDDKENSPPDVLTDQHSLSIFPVRPFVPQMEKK
jgi:hypothetical protein